MGQDALELCCQVVDLGSLGSVGSVKKKKKIGEMYHGESINTPVEYV